MGKHHTMVEYYPDTTSSHLLVTMHVLTEASKHPSLHTLYCGSPHNKMRSLKVRGYFPPLQHGKEGWLCRKKGSDRTAPAFYLFLFPDSPIPILLFSSYFPFPFWA